MPQSTFLLSNFYLRRRVFRTLDVRDLRVSPPTFLFLRVAFSVHLEHSGLPNSGFEIKFGSHPQSYAAFVRQPHSQSDAFLYIFSGIGPHFPLV